MPENMEFYIAVASDDDGLHWSEVIWHDGEANVDFWRSNAQFAASLSAAPGKITIHGPYTTGPAL